MPRFYSRLLRIGALGIAMLVLFGCGLGGTTTIVQGGATNTPPPTPTRPPTATPTPGHLLVTVNPHGPLVMGTTSDGICHNGSTCQVEGPCTSTSADWPDYILSNSGQAALTWSVTINAIPGTGTTYAGNWDLSPTSGTIAGGGATVVKELGGNQGGGAQYVFHGPAQTVTINILCGIG